MLRKIKFKNFYSFNQEEEINFLAKKKNTYDYFQSKSKDQITKVAGFIGDNASGKTNTMRMFSFLNYFVCTSKREDINFGPDIAYKTFFNNDKSSSFSIEFEKDNFIFFYEFSFKKNIVIKEELNLKKNTEGARKERIFLRRFKKIENLNKKYFKNFPIKSLENIRPDVSLVSFIKANFDVQIINTVYEYFAGFRTNINERGDINSRFFKIQTIGSYIRNPRIKKDVEEIIRNFNIGVNSFEINKKIEKDKFEISIQGIHNTIEKNNRINFNYESSGTQSLFFTLPHILSAIKNNNIVIIDEIERGLHPEAVNKLISYFIDENEENKAQMIFSSHSLGFMNKLDMHQIYLTEKSERGESHICRLNELKPRSDENFLAKYMTGAYGAFPRIRI